jgi:hypothetical protein
LQLCFHLVIEDFFCGCLKIDFRGFLGVPRRKLLIPRSMKNYRNGSFLQLTGKHPKTEVFGCFLKSVFLVEKMKKMIKVVDINCKHDV